MYVELAHDSLAQVVYEQASIEDKTRLRIAQFFKDNYDTYKTQKNWLDEAQILLIEPYIHSLTLTAEEHKFWTQSQRYHWQRRKRRRISTQLFIVLPTLVILGVIAFKRYEIKEFYAQQMQKERLLKLEEEASIQAMDTYAKTLKSERDALLSHAKKQASFIHEVQQVMPRNIQRTAPTPYMQLPSASPDVAEGMQAAAKRAASINLLDTTSAFK